MKINKKNNKYYVPFWHSLHLKEIFYMLCCGILTTPIFLYLFMLKISDTGALTLTFDFKIEEVLLVALASMVSWVFIYVMYLINELSFWNNPKMQKVLEELYTADDIYEENLLLILEKGRKLGLLPDEGAYFSQFFLNNKKDLSKALISKEFIIATSQYSPYAFKLLLGLTNEQIAFLQQQADSLGMSFSKVFLRYAILRKDQELKKYRSKIQEIGDSKCLKD